MDDVPVEWDALGRRRGRRHLPSGEEAEDRETDGCRCSDWRFRGERSGEDRSEQDRDIGAGFDQPSSAQHFVMPQVLRQDCIFDRAEEGRVRAHREHGREHQRDVGEHDARSADDHDPDLRQLDDPDQPRLVVIVGELA